MQAFPYCLIIKVILVSCSHLWKCMKLLSPASSGFHEIGETGNRFPMSGKLKVSRIFMFENVQLLLSLHQCFSTWANLLPGDTWPCQGTRLVLTCHSQQLKMLRNAPKCQICCPHLLNQDDSDPSSNSANVGQSSIINTE